MKLGIYLNDEISFGAVKIPIKDTIQKYRERYDKLTSRKKITYTMHYVMPTGRIIIHFKIPSESVDKLFYDVLLELKPGSKHKFEECDVRFFSNCPSFVYTYAYTFYNFRDPSTTTKLFVDDFGRKIPQNNLIVKPSAEKYDDKILGNQPKVRNPYGLPLLDKSLYFAIFFMMDKLNYDRTLYNKHLSTIDAIMKDVQSFDSIMMEHKRLINERKKERQADHARQSSFIKQHEKSLERQNVKTTKEINPVKKLTPTKSTKSLASTSATRKMKSSNRSMKRMSK